MKKLLLKFCSALVKIKYPNMKYEHRYFIRDNYYSRIYQVKFFWKDYIRKSVYKEIDYRGEFQIEITLILPFAYWHYLNGTLWKTISAKHTKEFYFFSKNHEEKYLERDWTYNYCSYQFPNMTHSITKNYSKWAQVPLKEVYSNNIFKFDKPSLIIANKYNTEWDSSPINYLSITTLEKIFFTYKKKYQIIYNRPQPTQIVPDNSEVLDLNEHEWLKRDHPDIILLSDLYEQHKGNLINNFNHLQLMVYANCINFISVHGGGAALCSYFGGANIILSHGWMESLFEEYTTFWPRLSGAKIMHAKDEQEVLLFLEKNY